MVGSKSDAMSAAAWERAKLQHGLLTRQDLLAIGYGRRSIQHRVAKGRLHLVTRGVYAVGWQQLTPKRRWMAAVLACGEGAVLSHRSAATLWGMTAGDRGAVDVSVRRRCEHRRVGIRARSRPSLPDEDVTVRDGIPVTTPARTLLDLATVVDALAL